jgi:hypothetical protein
VGLAPPWPSVANRTLIVLQSMMSRAGQSVRPCIGEFMKGHFEWLHRRTELLQRSPLDKETLQHSPLDESSVLFPSRWVRVILLSMGPCSSETDKFSEHPSPRSEAIIDYQDFYPVPNKEEVVGSIPAAFDSSLKNGWRWATCLVCQYRGCWILAICIAGVWKLTQL